MRDFFYRPIDGYVGDVIPYYENGIFYLYYLHAHRNPEKYGEGTSWYLITTSDFVHYTEFGEVLPHATKEYQDLNAFTGSIIKQKDTYYLYYTGYNAYEQYCSHDVPLQAIMLAVSKDLIKWEKLPQYTFYTSDDIYEMSDWRDPFVFKNEATGKYCMLIAARENKGPMRRRGCIGLCTSENLLDWNIESPFFSPGLYMTHECPEVFQMGDWWYLIYSTFSERFATHYRMAKFVNGPWIVSEDDTIDGRGFYAGKTASDGEKRYIFGWIPTKQGKNDFAEYEWAGNLIVHELRQNQDGTLSVCIPDSVESYFGKKIAMNLSRSFGECTISESSSYMNVPAAFGAVLSERDLPLRCKITCQMQFEEGTKGFGIMLKSDENFDVSYYIRLEPCMNRMVFDMWPRKIKKAEEDTWEINGDKAFFVELERPCELKSREIHKVTIILDDTMCGIYLDGKKTMSVRMYRIRNGKLGFFASEGTVHLLDFGVYVPNEQQEEMR